MLLYLFTLFVILQDATGRSELLFVSPGRARGSNEGTIGDEKKSECVTSNKLSVFDDRPAPRKRQLYGTIRGSSVVTGLAESFIHR